LELYAKIYDSQYNIFKNEFKINKSSNGNQNCPSISIGPNDNILIIYESFLDDFDIVFKIFDKDLIIIKEESVLNSYTRGVQGLPVLSKISDDLNIVCWRGKICDDCYINDISCRIVNFQGNTFNSDFLITKKIPVAKQNISLANINSRQIIVGFDLDNYDTTRSNLDAFIEMSYQYQKVNVSITYNQSKPLIVPLKNGDFFVFFLCEGCAKFSNNEIKYRYFNSNGVVSFGGTVLETLNADKTNDFSAVSLSNGNVLIVWDNSTISKNKVIYGKLVNINKNIIKEKFIISSILTNNTIPKIVTNNDGINLVIWNEEDTANNSKKVCGQFYNNNGDNISSNIIPKTSSNINSNACFIGDKKFLILYDNYSNANRSGIFYYSIEPNISSSTTETLLIPNVSDKIFSNSGCTLIGDNKIVVIFKTDSDVFFQIFYNDLSTFLNRTNIDNQIFNKYNPKLINLIGGEFLIGWEESDSDGSGLGVYYKSFKIDGTEKTSKNLANTFTYKDQKNISIGQLIDQTIVVVFSSWGDGDSDGIYYDFIINCPENRYIDSTFNNRCSLKDCKSFIGNCNVCPELYFKLFPDNINCVNSDIKNYLSNPIPKYGYFLKCSTPCDTCNKSIENCSTCISQNAKLIQKSSDIITCSESINGYYYDSITMFYKKCDDSCLTCVENPKKCITWNISSNYFSKFDQVDSCISKDKSPDGYYFNSISYKHEKCDDSCLTCVENPKKCITWNISSNYFSKFDQINSCIQKDKSPDGYYFNSISYKHEKCDDSCLTCVENPKKCITCNISSNYLNRLEDNSDKCVVKCPDGYNNIPVKGVCQICEKNCKTCEFKINNCKSCYQSNYLLEYESGNFTCFKGTEGIYLDKGNKIYKRCDMSCKSCIDDSKKCLFCNTDYFMRENIENTCFDKKSIKLEEFIDPIDSKIKNCNKSCKKCIGKSVSCITCNNDAGFYEFKDPKDNSLSKKFNLIICF